MPQTSGPLQNQTFTDQQWRALIGDEPAVLGDSDGSAYALSLPTASNDAALGSPSQDSISSVGGFMHLIPAGQTQTIPIPEVPTGGQPRTDIIAVRYDPNWGSEEPGPCRLHRIAGTPGAGLPTYDGGPPGVEDLPLWAVRRSAGQSLSQAVKTWLAPRRGPSLTVPTVANLPLNSPLGTRVRTEAEREEWVRDLEGGQAVWSPAEPPLYGFERPLAGGQPPARTRQLHQVGYEPITTQPDGAAIIGFPRPFPNGLLALQVTLYAGIGVSTPAPASLVVYPPDSTFVARRPSRSSFHVVVLAMDGRPYSRGSFGIGYDAVGW